MSPSIYTFESHIHVMKNREDEFFFFFFIFRDFFYTIPRCTSKVESTYASKKYNYSERKDGSTEPTHCSCRGDDKTKTNKKMERTQILNKETKASTKNKCKINTKNFLDFLFL